MEWGDVEWGGVMWRGVEWSGKVMIIGEGVMIIVGRCLNSRKEVVIIDGRC